MSKKLKIVVDCDEVLRCTVSRMVELYNKEFNASKKMEDIKDFDVAISFPDILERQEFLQHNGSLTYIQEIYSLIISHFLVLIGQSKL